jgi:hypothetical protein
MSAERDDNLPLPIVPAPGVSSGDVETLLSETFARAGVGAVEPNQRAALRARLLGRVAASHAGESAMFTARRARLPREVLAEGVSVQTLYRADPGRPLRPGEPLRARLVELAAGAPLAAEVGLLDREWLVLAGSVQAADGVRLSRRDYVRLPAGHTSPAWRSPAGALLFLRESAPAGDEAPHTVLDRDAGWAEFAPGIRRRVMWQCDGQATMLYHADAGARVPNHTHGHDEECLMVQGELFLDDLLLQPGDYQLAPAGSGHRVTETDTGVVIYAHGDLDLRFIE